MATLDVLLSTARRARGRTGTGDAPLGRVFQTLLSWTALTVFLAWATVTAAISLRYWQGTPGSFGSLSLSAAALMALAAAATLHGLVPDFAGRSSPATSLSAHLLVSAVHLAFAAVLTFPVAPTLGVVVLWTITIASETAWWSRLARGGSSRKKDEFRCTSTSRTSAPATLASVPSTERPKAGQSDRERQGFASSLLAPARNASVELPVVGLGDDVPTPCEEALASDESVGGDPLEGEEEEDVEPLLPADTTQRWTRGRGQDGREWLEALVRVDWAPRQRHAQIPLAFCPPLQIIPTIETRVVDGAAADVAVTQAHTFGARLELRRSTPSPLDDLSVLLVRINASPDA